MSTCPSRTYLSLPPAAAARKGLLPAPGPARNQSASPGIAVLHFQTGQTRTVTDATANVLDSQRAAAVHRRRDARGAQTLAKRLGLRLVAADALAIRRRRCGKGWIYLDPDNRVIRDRATVQRLARLAVPPAYADVLYAQDRGRASAGRRARCRRPAAIPLSSGLGEGARDPQGAAPRAARRRAAAHPPQRRPASRRRRADARIRLGRGDRAGGAQRHPAGHRKLCAPARHPRRGHAVEVERHHLRREHHADVSLQGRQDHRQGDHTRRASRPRSRCCGSCRDAACSSIAPRAATCATSPRTR